MKKKHIHLLIGLVVMGLSLVYAFWDVDLAQLGNALLSAHYIYLVFAIGIVIISYVLRAMRWRYLIRSVKDVRTSRLYSPLMIGFTANMLPARAGEFIRAYLLSKKERISFSASFATIFIERLFDLTLVLLLLVWVMFFMPGIFSAGGAEGTNHLLDKVKVFGITALSFCLFIFLFSALLQYKNNLAMKIVDICTRPFPHKWKEKIFGMVHSFTNGLEIIRDRQGLSATIILTFLIWGSFIILYYPLYLAFGIQVDMPVISSLVILSLTVAIFITVVPTPGFIGSYQLGCIAALNGIFGIEKAVALSFGIVAWVVVMGSTVIIGTLFAVKEHVSLGELSAGKERMDQPD